MYKERQYIILHNATTSKRRLLPEAIVIAHAFGTYNGTLTLTSNNHSLIFYNINNITT